MILSLLLVHCLKLLNEPGWLVSRILRDSCSRHPCISQLDTASIFWGYFSLSKHSRQNRLEYLHHCQCQSQESLTAVSISSSAKRFQRFWQWVVVALDSLPYPCRFFKILVRCVNYLGVLATLSKVGKCQKVRKQGNERGHLLSKLSVIDQDASRGWKSSNVESESFPQGTRLTMSEYHISVNNITYSGQDALQFGGFL